MPRLEIPFVGPSYNSDSKLISPQECINFYLRPYPDQGAQKMALIGTPGLTRLTTPLAGECRGAITYSSTIYIVIYNTLYTITADEAYTTWTATAMTGTLNTISGRVGIETNGVDVTIVDGTNGYYLTIGTTTLTQITDSDFPNGCSSIAQIDGYYLVENSGTEQVYRSDQNDGSSWDGLAFSSAGGNPDPIISLLADHRDLYLIGTYTTEIWHNVGSATFNFSRIEGAFIEHGGLSKQGKCATNGAVYWLGNDKDGFGHVIQCLGRQPKAIDTYPVHQSILDQGNQTDEAAMWSYQQQGHTFVVLGFPAITWVYDTSTKEWHRRSSRISGEDTRWRANCHTVLGTRHIVGDYNNGKVYQLDPDVYEEDGGVVIRERIAPILRDRQNRITIDEVEVLCEKGVGLISGDDQDTDPQMMFSWSKDGGRTWSVEIDMPMGKIGEHDKRALVQQLGQGINWTFRLRISAAVKTVILGAYAEAENDG